jgi:hypothetical protein
MLDEFVWISSALFKMGDTCELYGNGKGSEQGQRFVNLWN